jgi:hypothetical protein
MWHQVSQPKETMGEMITMLKSVGPCIANEKTKFPELSGSKYSLNLMCTLFRYVF